MPSQVRRLREAGLAASDPWQGLPRRPRSHPAGTTGWHHWLARRRDGRPGLSYLCSSIAKQNSAPESAGSVPRRRRSELDDHVDRYAKDASSTRPADSAAAAFLRELTSFTVPRTRLAPVAECREVLTQLRLNGLLRDIPYRGTDVRTPHRRIFGSAGRLLWSRPRGRRTRDSVRRSRSP